MDRSLFIWIPKTAGTSLVRLLDRYDIGFQKIRPRQECIEESVDVEHKTYRHMYPKDIIKQGWVPMKDFHCRFKYTFVRDPYDRAVSLWSYQIQRPAIKSISSDTTFVQWLEKAIKTKPNTVQGRFISPMVNYLYDYDSNLIPDYIGKLEQYNDDMSTIHKKLNLKFDRKTIPTSNKSHHRHYLEYYNDTTKQLVADIYHDDIEKLDYKYL